MDLTRATKDTPGIQTAVHEQFAFAPWNPDQIERGARIREALANAYLAVIENAPPSPTRTVALRKIYEARMDANAAITFEGRV